MSTKLAVVGIFAVLAIVSIVLIVGPSSTGFSIYDNSYFVKPSGLHFNAQSGVEVLQGDQPIISSCSSTVFCDGNAAYACCSQTSNTCVLPGKLDEIKGACPDTHRSRCQCREAYIADLFEIYGEI